jgi:hypothetical protein
VKVLDMGLARLAGTTRGDAEAMTREGTGFCHRRRCALLTARAVKTLVLHQLDELTREGDGQELLAYR